MDHPVVQRLAAGYLALGAALRWLQGPLLLCIRLVFGASLVATALARLDALPEVALYLEANGVSGGLAAPLAGADLVGGVALIGGIACRVSLLPALAAQITALASTDLYAVLASGPGDVAPLLAAPPFTVGGALLLVWIIGPGALSVDGLVHRWWKRRSA